MDLKSGYPYWAIKNGLMYAFPRLESDATCDVLVIGAGITGALIARSLAAEDLDVVVVEERDIAWGSTSASTALLQYEIDTHMTELAERYGEPTAAKVYTACGEAISMLRTIAREIRDVDFSMQRSLYLASSRWHIRKLRSEFEMRAKHGFDVTWLDRHDVREQFDLEAPCAILSGLGAQVDPYRLASRVLHKLSSDGVRIFDKTSVERIEKKKTAAFVRTLQMASQSMQNTSSSPPATPRKSGLVEK